MKSLSSSFLALILASQPLSAAEQMVTLGDSLTFAYEASFQFQVDLSAFDEGIIGDGFDASVLNWAEILASPSYRSEWFDQGGGNSLNVENPLYNPIFPIGNPNLFTLYLRPDYNWAVPGARIDDLREFMVGNSSVTTILASNPEFAEISTFIGLTDFTDSDFALTDLEDQIRNSAERLVFFIGGNDVRGIYGTVYNGNPAGTFVADFIDDATFILDRVLFLNPDIEVVVVNVPHIGITPDIKTGYPTDPVKTGRVSAVLEDLNAQLKQLAEARNLAFADVYTPTLRLLSDDPLCIDGIPFANTGSTTGDLDFVWLNGEISANFHPNTNAQMLIANIIIEAFNDHYELGIPPLSTTEILGEILGKSAAQIDMPFANWMTGFGLNGLGQDDDSDGDGIPAGIEFGLGLDPTFPDADKVVTSMIDDGPEPAIEITYPERLPSSSNYTLQAASGLSLSDFTPMATQPTADPDGLKRARLPVINGRGFLRLQTSLND